MKTIVKNLFLVVCIFVFVGCVSKSGNDWTQFRGINSLGIAPQNATPPLELNPDRNLAWKFPLASGLSSPCIFKGRIFITGFNPKDSALITYCIDQVKGSLLWERSVFPDTLEKVHQLLGSPATPTPASDGTVVYIYFGAYGVLCYNLEGILLWERRLPILNAQYGSNGSPIIHDSLLILNRIELEKPSVLVLNKNSGAIVWESFLENVLLGSMPADVSQSTPVIWKDQVIIHRSFELVSLSLKDGSLKWTVEIGSSGNATPIIINDTLFVNCWFNFGNPSLFDSIPEFKKMISKYDANHDNLININEIPLEMAMFKRPELNIPTRDTLNPVRGWARGYDSNKDLALGKEEWSQLQKLQLSYIKEHAVIALKLDLIGESDKPVLLWKEKDYVAEVPSLVRVGSRIYMVMNGGNLLCIDSKTGVVIFNNRLGAPGAYLSSPLYANGYIYFAGYNGKITVVKPGDKLNVIARSDLREKIGSSPAALGRMLYIRTDSALYAFKK